MKGGLMTDAGFGGRKGKNFNSMSVDSEKIVNYIFNICCKP